MNRVLDILFPKSCHICSKEGTYLCSRCKKLFKRNLPECYKCRRISKNFVTHKKCKDTSSLDSIFVCWEYNSLSSKILKRYKYSYVKDISETLSSFFIEEVRNSEYLDFLKDSLITTVPISGKRLRERGFNQLSYLANSFCSTFNFDLNEEILFKIEDTEHQAMKDKEERTEISSSSFLVNEDINLKNYKSITIIDDVITTGSTLESIARCLRKNIKQDLPLNGICLFRGKPDYSSVSSESLDSLVSLESLESSF